MNDISLRIKQLIEEKKLNISSFEKKIGVGNNSIGTIITKNTNVSGAILSKILKTFDDVNAKWLITGEGNIYNDKPNINPITLENIELMRENIKLKDENIFHLKEKLQILEEKLQECECEKKLQTNIVKVV